MQTAHLSAVNSAIAAQCRLWRTIALVMLLAGWGGGSYLVWRGIVQERQAAAHAGDDDDEDLMLPLEESKKQSRELEMYMGKMGMIMYKIEQAMDAWSEPKPMGITIIIVASLGAALANGYANLLLRRAPGVAPAAAST